jgi:hypothetical protein
MRRTSLFILTPAPGVHRHRDRPTQAKAANH